MSSIQKFSSKKFRDAIDSAFEQGKLGDEEISSKQDIYEYIEKNLFRSNETIRKWASPKSNGPKEPQDIKKLEEIFGVSLRQENGETSVSVSSDFVKSNILNAYSIIKDYLMSEEPENEECFIKMCNSIEKMKISFPDSLYEQIQNFIKNNLQPMVYDYETVFHEEHSEEYGEWGEDGTFIIKGPDCKYYFMKMMEIHIKTIMEIEQKFDDFAIKYMRPYIL